jgi:hypothetical protein
MKEKLPRINHKAYFPKVLTYSYAQGYFSLFLLKPSYLSIGSYSTNLYFKCVRYN